LSWFAAGVAIENALAVNFRTERSSNTNEPLRLACDVTEAPRGWAEFARAGRACKPQPVFQVEGLPVTAGHGKGRAR
jgi:hypothetical protein